ncbi:MAG: amidohydrolase family protein [Candidatus Nanopelagicales bacterium]
MTRHLAAAVVAPDRVLRGGWVDVVDGRVAAVGEADVPDPDAVDLGDVVVVPGFVDLHCHGGGGASFGADPDESARAAAVHLAHGTTSVMASLVTGPRERLAREVAALRDLVESQVLLGVHLEGPWLSSARCGAHDPAQLRVPDRAELGELVSPDTVRMVTIAPELEGGLDAVRRIVGHGAIAAVGHTDADHATTVRAVEAGARHATHLFNAMRPLHHRDPGPVVALLEHDEVSLELIRDGVHLDPALCAWLDATVPPSRLVAVTDAMAAAASADGRYALGQLEIDVVDSVARVAGTSTIAGSTATMDRLFSAVAGADPDDADLLRAVRQTSANPAHVVGRRDLGGLVPGARADLVVLDPATLQVLRAMRGGDWVADDPRPA